MSVNNYRVNSEDGFANDEREAYKFMRELDDSPGESYYDLVEDIGEANEELLTQVCVAVDDSFWFN